MLLFRVAILSLISAATLASGFAQDLERFIYPLAGRKEAPKVTLDVRDAPNAAKWAAAAKELVENWYPVVISFLSTNDFKQPAEIKLVFKKAVDVPAYASGNSITISSKWISEHPNDLGMVIHELVHVLQRYPPNPADIGWLTEGISDYIRWWRYEPEADRPRITEASRMTDGYRVTAYFLAWAGKKYDLRLVPRLDSALRKGENPMPVFVEVCGKPADLIWEEFRAATSR